MKKRLDVLLVERGNFESRARARAAIEAGLVSIDGESATKPAAMVDMGASISAAAPHPYVSRGGVKLAAALNAFGLDPAGRDCLDVGASTGGFSDVLLRRGARSVVCVDNGRGQLHPRIAEDPRILQYEGQDIRLVDPDWFAKRPTLAVIDVSFISLKLVLPAVVHLLTPAAEIVALVKPQFEVGKGRVGKGGVVRDDTSRVVAVADVQEVLETLGFKTKGAMESPIAGGDGNIEYLLHATRGT